MTNYLNQIESDLYKLNSITNGSGEVVEMVTELKEKYRKAEAWEKLNEYVSTSPYDGIDMDTLKNRLNRFINESGDYDAKK
ncbi:hypothetical protein [Jeotgalicoccus psychrophilus]|uniref:hypothetical protein n=1 Tax=Jeotgalicoccus psychrophilus TaxID=157228 RepID=UPI00047E6EC9|nr:hypothetical protein [Jeotgalicoccus psychrophilus]